jgi:uncharacterized protein (TIGR03435 family)
MRTDSRELLAIGIFGPTSHLGSRIELLLARGRAFSPQASVRRIAASAAVLVMFVIAASLAPRWIAFAQRLEFEVASIKPADPNGPVQSSFSMKGGRFQALSNLRMLIQFGYDVRNHQISGGPSWMDSLKFAVEAKPDGATPLPPGSSTPEFRAMVRSLLEDRFKLALHRENREQPIYYLALARGGSHLKPAEKEAGVGMGENRISSAGAPIATLANMLAAVLGRSVIDRTGLEGLFEFRLEWTPDDTPADLATGPSLFTAIQEQLGLRLESAKGPVEVLVIDHAEKPDAN